MRNVLCTVIQANTLNELKDRVGEFSDMDVSYFDKYPTARTFTHYQVEENGIEYVTLLNAQGEILNSDTACLCISRPVDAIPLLESVKH